MVQSIQSSVPAVPFTGQDDEARQATDLVYKRLVALEQQTQQIATESRTLKQQSQNLSAEHQAAKSPPG